jgi:hypothetical protein
MSSNNELSQALDTVKKSVETALLVAQTALQVVNQLQQDANENKWVPIDEAVAVLGSGISERMLRERINNGMFKYGTHYINTSDGDRPNYCFRVASLRRFFETHPANRPLPKRSDAA